MMDEAVLLEKKKEKRVFGYFEAAFNGLYLLAAAAIGCYILLSAQGKALTLAGIMALTLALGDAFHLLPRMAAAITGEERRLRKALGFGKLVTSLTMTAFYVLLWHVGLLLFSPGIDSFWTWIVYGLAAARMGLCLMKQNRWFDEAPPVKWGIYRNIPFLLLGIAVAALFGSHAKSIENLRSIWTAIALSFIFYIPVVLFAGKHRKAGMLMLPKTCAYLWILSMFVPMV